MSFEVIEHPTVPYDQGRQRTTLDPTLATSKIDVRITGTVERTSGSTGDAAVYDDHLQRLVDHGLTVDDDIDLIDPDVPLRWLYPFHRLNVSEVRTAQEVDASQINSGNPQPFDLSYSLHGVRQFLRPFAEGGDARAATFWPQWDGRWAPEPDSGFYLYHNFSTATQGAGTAPGVGAIFSAGSDTYEFTEGPNITVRQHVFPQQHRLPLLPVYQFFTSGTYQSADPRFEVDFKNKDPFDVLMLTQVDGPDQLLSAEADLWNELYIGTSSRGGGGRSIFNDAERWGLEAEAIHNFLAYHGVTGTGASPGTIPLDFARGDITQRVDPRDWSSFLARLDVPDPAQATGHSDPGRFVVMQSVLESTNYTIL